PGRQVYFETGARGQRRGPGQVCPQGGPDTVFRCARAGDPCGKIRAVKSRVARLFGCSAVWALCACGDKPTEVELRLFPCVSAPTSVSLTIQSYGEGGEKIGAPLAKTFRIDDQGVFDDGFA